MASKLILVVDDSPSLRAALTVALTHAGYRVAEAESGAAALELARRCLPDLVLLDLRLPTLSGWQVAQALRLDPRTADIPRIAISALDGVDPVEIQRCGFRSFLPKPFTLKDLCGALSAALGPLTHERPPNEPGCPERRAA